MIRNPRVSNYIIAKSMLINCYYLVNRGVQNDIGRHLRQLFICQTMIQIGSAIITFQVSLCRQKQTCD